MCYDYRVVLGLKDSRCVRVTIWVTRLICKFCFSIVLHGPVFEYESVEEEKQRLGAHSGFLRSGGVLFPRLYIHEVDMRPYRVCFRFYSQNGLCQGHIRIKVHSIQFFFS